MMTIDQVLQRLKEGNKRFVDEQLHNSGTNQARRQQLEKGQEPYAIILGCADSRVVPETTFDAGLGELFSVRVAGNVANTSSLASIEYAVAHLGTKVIVVLGHQSCGAVTAAVNGGDNGYHLNHLLSHITPALAATDKGADINSVVRKNAQLTAEELQTRSKIISQAVSNGDLKIVPAYYNLDSGKVDFL